ncbi:unnamed protein product [Notodromas monacha]|uniref:RRM domain-containing protein n=1 Tax=Notodromas monacha TaxID=399045 RepID=A0A7R9GC77_9CRUS|nr:unnamed protein product [Notodromas monacha]CAG0915823.1 unnamed protein product [Notodromas monacha]
MASTEEEILEQELDSVDHGEAVDAELTAEEEARLLGDDGPEEEAVVSKEVETVVKPTENPVTDVEKENLVANVEKEIPAKNVEEETSVTDAKENPATDAKENPATDAKENPATDAKENPATDSKEENVPKENGAVVETTGSLAKPSAPEQLKPSRPVRGDSNGIRGCSRRGFNPRDAPFRGSSRRGLPPRRGFEPRFRGGGGPRFESRPFRRHPRDMEFMGDDVDPMFDQDREGFRSRMRSSPPMFNDDIMDRHPRGRRDMEPMSDFGPRDRPPMRGFRGRGRGRFERSQFERPSEPPAPIFSSEPSPDVSDDVRAAQAKALSALANLRSSGGNNPLPIPPERRKVDNLPPRFVGRRNRFSPPRGNFSPPRSFSPPMRGPYVPHMRHFSPPRDFSPPPRRPFSPPPPMMEPVRRYSPMPDMMRSFSPPPMRGMMDDFRRPHHETFRLVPRAPSPPIPIIRYEDEQRANRFLNEQITRKTVVARQPIVQTSRPPVQRLMASQSANPNLITLTSGEESSGGNLMSRRRPAESSSSRGPPAKRWVGPIGRTRRVRIENFPPSMNDTLESMCLAHGGPIEKFEMLRTSQGRLVAMVQFANEESADRFQLRYHKRLIEHSQMSVNYIPVSF